MSELAMAWRLLAARPVESACALVALSAWIVGLLWGLPVLAVGLGWA